MCRLYLTSIGWFSSYFLLSLSNYCNCRLLMLGMYSFSLKIQLRIFLEHKKAIPFLTTYQKVFLVIFLMICYLVSSWMSFITSLRLALLGFRSDIVHGLLFRFLVIQYLYEATVNEWLQVKVLLPDKHNVSSTLVKLDASIALRLCVFLDEPVLKQLEVRFLKDGDSLCL